MNAVYWDVTTAIINWDWTYEINVESNISDIEYRDCTYVQQPWINTFPKVWDTVLLIVITKGEYAILWIISYSAKQDLVIGEDQITISETATVINSNDVQLIWTTITANGEDLIVDDIWIS